MNKIFSNNNYIKKFYYFIWKNIINNSFDNYFLSNCNIYNGSFPFPFPFFS